MHYFIGHACIEHYSPYIAAKVEMLLEKLQMVEIAVVQPKYKVRWFKWWNNSETVQKDLRFSKYPVGEDTLKKWMDRIVLWTMIGESVT